jgi:hypothetical protein
VSLGVEVLDAEGRRIGPRHLNWFQVLPGDTLTCAGCHVHDPNGPTAEVHGRSDGTAPSINSGIQTSTYANTQIPGTSFPYFSLNLGETMAEVRFDRVGSTNPLAPEPVLSADLNFVDYWTDPLVTAAVPAIPYSYRYDDLDPSILSPALPAKPLRNANCNNTVGPRLWSHNCRVTINYPRHIQAIWELDRGAADLFTPLAPANPINPADPTNTPLLVDNVNIDGILDDTCTSCHTSVVANVARLPYGQLDLSIDPNQNPNNFSRAYRELLFNDPGQEIDVMGNLVDINPAVGVAASMTANGARNSFFIEKMTGTELDAARAIPVGSVDHTTMLTGAELKLISEWLDLGAQNFNDPFDPAVPQN